MTPTLPLVPDPVPVSGRSMARKGATTLAGQIPPILVAVACVPFLIRGLGLNRFGVLTLALTLLSFLGLLDLGLGRATTRLAADAHGRGDQDSMAPAVWTSLAAQLFAGVVAGTLLALGSGVIAAHLNGLSASDRDEARDALVVLALALPFLICTVSIRGILEATQRFGTVAIVRAISGSSIFLLPAAGVAFHLGLPGIVGLLVASSVATAATYLVIDFALFPALRRPRLDAASLRGLFGFGGWTTLASVAILSLLYGDRLILAARAPIATLTYYSVPYDLVTRLQVIPAAFATVLFPTFTSVLAADPARLRPLYLRTVRYSFLLMALPTFAAILLAHPILTLWLGSDFATHGTLVMELLAAGVFLNAVSQVPANLLDAVGRPDLRAKIFLALMPVYLGAAWILITYWGADGAATGWATRASLELVIFLATAYSLLKLSRRDLADLRLGRGCIWLVSVDAIAVMLNSVGVRSPGADIAVHLGFLVLAVLAFWRLLLDPRERIALLALARPPWRARSVRPAQPGG